MAEWANEMRAKFRTLKPLPLHKRMERSCLITIPIPLFRCKGFSMSFQAMAWAVDQKLPMRDKIVLLMLANYASNETGDCYPSLTSLSEQCGASVDSVVRAIKSLEEIGLVAVKRRKMDGVNLPNYYTLNLRGVPAHSEGGTRTERGGVPAQSVSNLSSEPINEPISPIVPKVGDAFDRFWAVYPKRDGSNPRKPAEMKFRVATKRVDPELIISAAAAYAEDQRKRHAGKPSQYTKQASVWLNQECWTDYSLQPSQEIDWSDWVLAYKSDRVWKDILGPKPGQAGCRAPITVLRENGFAS